MSFRPFSTQSSSRSTPESGFPRSSSSSFIYDNSNDVEDDEASEQLKRNITGLAREAAGDARNARNDSLNEAYISKLAEELEVELGVRRS
jgi:hypothetical protein